MTLNVRPARSFSPQLLWHAGVTKRCVTISRDINFQLHGSVLCVTCRSFLIASLLVLSGIKFLHLKCLKQLSEKRTEYAVIIGLEIWPVSLHKLYILSLLLGNTGAEIAWI